MISSKHTGASKFYLTHPYPCRVKDKIENFLVVDVHWLYMYTCRTSRYAFVKFQVTERNDVTNRHVIVITMWRTSAVEVTALSKIPF